MKDRHAGLVYAAIAVCLFSTSPVLIRWASPIPAFEIACVRLLVAAAALGLVRAIRREHPSIGRTDHARFILFGLITALHFLLYIASLQFTTISHSLALVYTAPVFVAIFSARILREPVARRRWLGILVNVCGIAVLTGFQPRLTGRMVAGDLMAVGSAVMFGLYSVAGRSQRDRYPLATYAFFVYGWAGLWLLPAAVLTAQPAARTPVTLSAVVALGLIPLAAGHTLYNAALRRAHATLANLIATQEVTGGILLGIILLGEVPGWNEAVGALVALVGVALVIM